MTHTINTVTIIGAGQMGVGIAQVFAAAEFDVNLTDISDKALESAVAKLSGTTERLVNKGVMTPQERAGLLGRLCTTKSITEAANVDLIIEAATESFDIKKQIFEDIVPHIGEHTVLTTNTSSLSITKLASLTPRPERFMGFHFMNPVPVMNLVELIRAISTSQEIFDVILQTVERIGKTPAASEDYPGFIVNRILIPMINEAVYTLFEGVGTVESIDASMRLGANHPLGPLQLADLIGLDTCLAIMEVLNSGLADPKYRPCPMLVKYVEAGWLGRKTGRGFYDYSSDQPIPTRQ